MVQNILAISLHVGRHARPGFRLGVGHDLQARASQHRLHGSMIGDPPVGWISSVFLLDKVHAGEVRVFKNVFVPEMVVVFQSRTGKRASNHGLEDQFTAHFLDHLIQGIERITQMIEDPHEEDIIEPAGNSIDIINRAFVELDLQLQHLRGKLGLAEITVVHIHRQHPARAPLFQFERVEASIAAQVEHRGPRHIFRKDLGHILPFHFRKIAKEMSGGGLNAF